MQEPNPPDLNDHPAEVFDTEILAGYQRTDGEPGDQTIEAIVREIELRGLDS